MQRACCLVCNGHGEVMVVHRKVGNQWEIPSSTVQLGETPQAAAVRALREALGVQVRITQKLGSRDGAQSNQKYTWFLAEITGGEPRLQDLQQCDKWGYFSLVTLTQRYSELSEGTKSFLEAMAYGEIDLDV